MKAHELIERLSANPEAEVFITVPGDEFCEIESVRVDGDVIEIFAFDYEEDEDLAAFDAGVAAAHREHGPHTIIVPAKEG